MALGLTNRGSGNHNASATSFTLSPASNLAAGSWAVLCVAADNSASGGATNNITSVTDSIGNTWIARRTPVFDNGGASAGVQGAIFTTDQAVGALQTGTVITVNFGAATTAKTWTLTEVTAAAAEVISYVTGGDKAAGATGTALTTGATASIASGDAVIAAFFIEAGTTQSLSAADTDTTNGSWSTNQYNEIGSTTSGSVIVSQGKVVTATGTQTYDVTLGISSDHHGSYIVLHATEARSGSLTGTGGGVLVSTASKAALAALTATGGGVETQTATKGAQAPLTGTGSGVAALVQTTARSASLAATGGGVLTYTYEVASGEPHFGSFTATGAGVATLAQSTGRSTALIGTAGGVAALTPIAGRAASVTATGGGVATLAQSTGRMTSLAATGGGAATIAPSAGHAASLAATGGGVASLSVTSARLAAALMSGGGIATIGQSTARLGLAGATGGGTASVQGTSAGPSGPGNVGVSVVVIVALGASGAIRDSASASGALRDSVGAET